MLINKYSNREELPGILEGSVEFAYNPTQRGKESLLYPEYLGEVYCDSSYCLSRNRYCHYYLMHLLSGTAVIQTGDCDYAVEEGQTFLICTAKPHVYGCTDSMHCLWIHFAGNGSDGIFDYLIKKNGMRHVFTVSPDSEYVNKLWDFIHIFSENEPDSELAISMKLYEVLALLGINSQQPSVSQIDRVIRYINQNYAEEIDLEELARAAQLSVSRFSEVFKNETNCSPYKYVINTRLHVACRMLSSTKLSVSEVAERVGFGSATSFIYSFRQKYGITPKQYMLKTKSEYRAYTAGVGFEHI